MKSTYKLIGVMWDRKSARPIMGIIPHDPTIQSIGAPPTLFDNEVLRQKVLLSDLLKMTNEQNLADLIESLKAVDEIIVELDYSPYHNGTVVSLFFNHRVSQMLTKLSEAYPDKPIIPMHRYTIESSI